MPTKMISCQQVVDVVMTLPADRLAERLPVAIGGCGSPPRVWGQRAGDEVCSHRIRFTPTRVGTTGAPGEKRTAPAVHPHACGDNARAR